jgi:hypothetical protein
MTSSDSSKPEQFEEVLTSVAESIGTTLGSLAARANAAKDALTPSSATQRKVVRQAKSLQRSAKKISREVSKKVSAGARKVSAGAKKVKKAAGKKKSKAKKVARKPVKKSKRK